MDLRALNHIFKLLYIAALKQTGTRQYTQNLILCEMRVGNYSFLQLKFQKRSGNSNFGTISKIKINYVIVAIISNKNLK